MVYSAALLGVQGRSLAKGVIGPTLKLLRSPLCYATTEAESEQFVEEAGRVLEWEIAEMLGTGPGLIRLRVDNLNASDHFRGLIVPYESRDHPQDATASTTAKLTYEAEDLTLRGGATEAERAGDSGKVVRHTGLTSGWLTVLSSEIDGVGHMTHVGPRRLWARIYDPGTAGSVELRLQFRPLGSMQWSSTGRTVPSPLADAFALVDIGECRPEPAVIGDQRWEWRLQARAPSGAGEIDIDQIHVCPIEHYTVVTSPDIPLDPDAASTKAAPTCENNASVGTTAWSNPTNAASTNNVYATSAMGKFNLSSSQSQYLLAKKFGFAIPEGATVIGIVFGIERKASVASSLRDWGVYATKAGAIGTDNHASPDLWPTSDEYAYYGDSNDLWGQTWTPAEINAEGFGVVLSAINGHLSSTSTGSVDHIKAIVYYTETDDENRVCFAERSIEFRSDGVYRQHPEDDVWGAVVPEGFYPVAPPSWLEGRAVRGLIIPSQGDLDVLADSGDNKVGLTVFSRAGYHFAREAV
jgi:hypothetical protein